MAKAENHPTISVEEIIRPTRVEVDLNCIRDNYIQVLKLVGNRKIMPVLKANAYGHGLIKIAEFMQELKVDYLGVAVLEEGILLRKRGIRLPILVLGGIWGNQIPLFIKYDLTMTASSIDKLMQIEQYAASVDKVVKVHLKIDTGMERIGVHYYNADKFLEETLKCRHVEVEGIYSHFANSESTDLSYTRLQLERFLEVVSFYKKHSLPVPLRHIANSGAILQLPDSYLDMVRPGIMIYGVYPSQEIKSSFELKAALRWKSLVVYFKVIKPGHPVGYGSSWQSDIPVRAVTIPVGYGDGYFRSMSDKAKVIINGKKYPVIGKISMDQIVVNIGDDSAYNGDEVILLGSEGSETISCEDLAEWAGTIPYEILTNINTRVPRVYIR
ncbi:MAG: alanine racemase [Ignavibacteriaceae bacterium]